MTPDSPLFLYSAPKQPLTVILNNSTLSWSDSQGFKLFLQAYELEGHPEASLVYKGLNYQNQSFEHSRLTQGYSALPVEAAGCTAAVA